MYLRCGCSVLQIRFLELISIDVVGWAVTQIRTFICQYSASDLLSLKFVLKVYVIRGMLKNQIELEEFFWYFWILY